ncbi:hypothetical protein NT04LM_3612, partial [Listeria monocytogenes FSL F2-208]
MTITVFPKLNFSLLYFMFSSVLRDLSSILIRLLVIPLFTKYSSITEASEALSSSPCPPL